MTSNYQSVAGLGVELYENVLTLTLDRQSKRNALDTEMVTGMIRVVDAAGQDEDVRVIVLRGAGNDFCSGIDIVARTEPTGVKRPRVGATQRRLPSEGHRLICLLTEVQTPVICEVRGWAVGMGLHLVLTADFAVVSHDALMWEPFSERGMSVDSGGAWLLPRRIGEMHAREMLLLGRKVSGREAAEWGLAYRSVSSDEFGVVVRDLVDSLLSLPTVAIGLTKSLLRSGSRSSLEEHLRHEALAIELAVRSEDFREGIAAFREKRPPRFVGR